MAKQDVYVELNPETGLPVRILKTMVAGFALPPDRVGTMARSVAVGYIREQVVARATKGKNVYCDYCGLLISPGMGHMHEVVPKGKGGEVSLSNCVFICPRCHIGSDGEHGDRKWGGKDAGRNY